MLNLVLGSSFYQAPSETRKIKLVKLDANNYNGANPCLGEPVFNFLCQWEMCHRAFLKSICYNFFSIIEIQIKCYLTKIN